GMTGDCFERFTPRNAMDIAIASAASRVTLDPCTGKIQEVAIVLGAVAPTPVRAPRAEDALRDQEPTPNLLAGASAIAKEECSPIDDIRGTASYRRAMIEVLVRRTLERAVERAQQA
ncbi:MAG: xanthine dehydrogenase family protein subunit M, partial [Dehalococcoidia bacterium]